MLEIVFPFMIIHKFLDCLEWCDQKVGTKFIYFVDAFFKGLCGPEILARWVKGVSRLEKGWWVMDRC